MRPDEELIQDIVGRVLEVAKPDQIIMFGSASRGTMGRNSDVDLLVIVPGVHRRRTTAEIYRRMKGAGYPVDVVVAHPEDIEQFGNSSAFVFSRALSEGQVIYDA